jgi:hypothetical protein
VVVIVVKVVVKVVVVVYRGRKGRRINNDDNSSDLLRARVGGWRVPGPRYASTGTLERAPARGRGRGPMYTRRVHGEGAGRPSKQSDASKGWPSRSGSGMEFWRCKNSLVEEGPRSGRTSPWAVVELADRL